MSDEKLIKIMKEFAEMMSGLSAIPIVFISNEFGLIEYSQDHQDEPHLIATNSDEADAIFDMWQNGKE